jgi:Ras-related protein Rab-4B
METSALSGQNVEEAFLTCARQVITKLESNEIDADRVGSGVQQSATSLTNGNAAGRAEVCGHQKTYAERFCVIL